MENSSICEPLVSIIIPVHNAELYIKETIDSVLAQSYKNIEVLLIENASTDKSLDIIKEYVGERVYLFNSDIANAAAARNIGIKHAKGQYLQFLDADDLIDVNKISSQMALLKQKCYPNDLLVFGSWDFIGRNKNFDDSILFHDFEKSLDYLFCMYDNDIFMVLHSYIVPSVLVRVAGLWDESLTRNDDGEWFARLANNAHGLLFCPSAYSYYRYLDNSLSKTKSSQAWMSQIVSTIKICKILEECSSPNKYKTIEKLVKQIITPFYPYYNSQRKKGEEYLKQVIPDVQFSYPSLSIKERIYYVLAKMGFVKSQYPL